MSAQISGIVREESPNNYKHVVMTMIGSVAELGFHSFSTYALSTVYLYTWVESGKNLDET